MSSCTCRAACRPLAVSTLEPGHPRLAQLLYLSRINFIIRVRPPRSVPRVSLASSLRLSAAKEVSCAPPCLHRDDVKFPPIHGGYCSYRRWVAHRDLSIIPIGRWTLCAFDLPSARPPALSRPPSPANSNMMRRLGYEVSAVDDDVDGLKHPGVRVACICPGERGHV